MPIPPLRTPLFAGSNVCKWILSGGGSFVMLLAGLIKLFPPPAAVEHFAALRVPPALLPVLGAWILYWIPRSAMFGLALLTAYLGAASAVNILIMHTSPALPVVLAAALWVGYGLRFPAVFAAAGLLPRRLFLE
jgi:hypothetical protein